MNNKNPLSLPNKIGSQSTPYATLADVAKGGLPYYRYLVIAQLSCGFRYALAFPTRPFMIKSRDPELYGQWANRKHVGNSVSLTRELLFSLQPDVVYDLSRELSLAQESNFDYSSYVYNNLQEIAKHVLPRYRYLVVERDANGERSVIVHLGKPYKLFSNYKETRWVSDKSNTCKALMTTRRLANSLSVNKVYDLFNYSHKRSNRK